MELTEKEATSQSGVDDPVDVEFVGDLAVLTMKCGQNRFNVAFCNKLMKALDKVESNQSIRALITTGEGRFFSNGLDLMFLGEIGSGPNAQKRLLQVRDEYLQPVFERFVTFPVPTIALLNGHCYAAGAILALCHDYRVMRDDKGWFCLNEVHIGLHFNPMMEAILRAKIPSGISFSEAVVFGRRYSGKEALEAGIAQLVASPDNILAETKKLASDLASKEIERDNLEKMKQGMYAAIIQARKDTYGKDDVAGAVSSKL